MPKRAARHLAFRQVTVLILTNLRNHLPAGTGAFEYSFGETPVNFLKARLKVALELKPQSRATASSVRFSASPVRSFSLTSLMRNSLTKSLKFFSKPLFITKDKTAELTPRFFDKSLSVSCGLR